MRTGCRACFAQQTTPKRLDARGYCRRAICQHASDLAKELQAALAMAACDHSFIQFSGTPLHPPQRLCHRCGATRAGL